MLEKARLAERLIAERDQAQERFERYSTAVDVARQIEALEASHPSSNGLPALREALAKVRAADMRIREINAALAGEIEVQFEMKAPTPRAWRPTAIAAVVVILAGVGIVLGGPARRPAQRAARAVASTRSGQPDHAARAPASSAPRSCSSASSSR